MPKTKDTLKLFFQRMSEAYPNTFKYDDKVLFCLICDETVNAKQSSQVNQHIQTGKHAANFRRKNKNSDLKTQQLLSTLPSPAENRSASEFAMDLTRAFLKSNIALHKITNPSVVEFIEKYTKFSAPNITTLRRKCVPELYNECIEQMKKIAAGKYLWVSLDETTDSEQRCVANFVFGVLGEPDRCYLFASKIMDATNSNTIAAFFDETINELSE